MVAWNGRALVRASSEVSVNAEPKRLEQALDYVFRQPDYLTQALTHRSAGGGHNERLEFLGDSILNFVIAAELYDRFPHATEGELSRLRASLVKEDTLADLARELELGSYLILGSGELKSGGYRRASILADALEAIIGGIYLDGGLERAREVILALYDARLQTLSPHVNLKDPKTLLQELLQSRRMALPEYHVVAVDGAPHEQCFRVECRLSDLDASCQAEGSSRRKAEQAAAKLMLGRIKRRLNG